LYASDKGRASCWRRARLIWSSQIWSCEVRVADGVAHGSIGCAHFGWRLVVASPHCFRRRQHVIGVRGDVVEMCTHGQGDALCLWHRNSGLLVPLLHHCPPHSVACRLATNPFSCSSSYRFDKRSSFLGSLFFSALAMVCWPPLLVPLFLSCISS
jgi:hypothetical protein